ncbi:unnamed protein product [Dicrocoelium dendriticum]|nr:unnamed protein product [Dicrocoelium dendriticum]
MRDKLPRFSSHPIVSVIGYPGSKLNRCHVGKSCLIHRFLSHTPYREDHLSILDFSEFDSEVVAGSHWLFWGYSDVFLFDDVAARVQIIEQCEFIDDHLFAPFMSNRIYRERCTSRTLTLSTRKLAYICKDQLGHEESFARYYLEPGCYGVSAFICVYDVTLSGSPAFHQAVFLRYVLHELSSANVPLVLVTSKHDSGPSESAISLLESSLKGISNRWLKRNFCIVETSSRRNVNVDKAFYYATAAASGCLYEIKRGSRFHFNNADRLLRSVLLRLLHFSSNKIPSCGHHSRKSADPLLSSLFADATDSFRLACATTQGPECKSKPQEIQCLSYGSSLGYRPTVRPEVTTVSRTSLLSKNSALDHFDHLAPGDVCSSLVLHGNELAAAMKNDQLDADPDCPKFATIQVAGTTSTVVNFSRRSSLPLFTATKLATRALFAHLITFATKESAFFQIAGKVNPATSSQLLSAVWTFGLSDHFSIVPKLLQDFQTDSSPTSSCTPLHATLISFPLGHVPHNSVFSDRRIFCGLPPLPSTTNALTSTEGVVNSNLAAVHYICLPQWADIHRDLELLGSSDDSLNVLFVHFLFSAWPAVEDQLTDFLDSLLLELSHPSPPQSEGSRSLSLNCIVVIALPDSATSMDDRLMSSDLCAGPTCLRRLAKRHRVQLVPLLQSVITLDDEENCSPVPRTVPSPHVSIPPSVANLRKPLLIVLSMLSDYTNEAVHRGLLQEHSALWPKILQLLEAAESDGISAVKEFTAVLHQKTVSDTHCPPTDKSPVINNPLQQPIIVTSEPHPPSFSFTDLQRLPSSTLVALPWLPLNPLDAIRLPTSRFPGFSHPKSLNPPYSPAVYSRPSFPIQSKTTKAEFSSSLDEYYDELPNVPRRKVFTIEQLRRRINRPKRPHPQKSFTFFQSSSLPLPDHMLPTSVSQLHMAPMHSVHNFPNYSVLWPQLHSCAPPHWPWESDGGVYAEVNDALVSEDSSVSTPLPPSFSSVA